MIEESDLEAVFAALKAPFPADKIEWRVGSTNKKKNGGVASEGFILAYLQARAVMDRFDDVVGEENWQNRLIYSPGGMICEIGLNIGGEWVWKSLNGAETDIEAEKGAGSDALKRCATVWGVGRYLYDLPKQWIKLNNGYIPKDFVPQLPAWALPDGESSVAPLNTKEKPVGFVNAKAIQILVDDLKENLTEDQQDEFKQWLKDEKFFVDGDWLIKDEDLEGIYLRISEIKEPI